MVEKRQSILAPRWLPLWLGGGFVGLLLLVSAATIYVQRRQAIDEWQGNLVSLARVLAEHAGQTIQAADLVQRSIAERAQGLGALDQQGLRTHLGGEAFYQVMRDKVSGISQIDVATIVAHNGDVVNFTRSHPPPPINLADRDYFKAHFSGTDLPLYLSGPVKNRGTGRWTFYLSRKLLGSLGQPVGLTLAGIESQFFVDFYRAVNFSEFSAISLYRTDGMLLARFPEREESMGRVLRDQPALKAWREGKEVVITREARLVDPNDTRFRIVAVKPVPGFPLVTVVVATEELVLRNWRQRSLILGGGTAAVSVLFILLMIWISRLLARREDMLAQLRLTGQQLEAKAEALARHSGEVQRHYDALHALNDIASHSHMDKARQFRDALEVGSRHFGLPIGILSHIEGSKYVITAQTSPPESGLAEGQAFDFAQTYCAITLQANDVVAIAHMAESEHREHPCYRAFKLEAYVGAPVMVEGRRVGTVNFSSPSPYRGEFDDGDIEFMRLLARWIGAVMERETASGQILAAKEAAEEAQSALAARSTELARSNAELEQFAYVASHDLRQPLRMVISYLSLIERTLAHEKSEEIKEFMGFAVDGARRMDALIQGLLEYSRLGRGRSTAPVPLAEVVSEARGNLTLAIADAGAEIQLAEDLPVVSGERTELMRLFQNLIGNAVKYRHPQRPPRIRLHCRAEDAEWVFTISDNGIGIAPEDRERAFAIFQRLVGRAEYEGAGIGLAVCRKIVEQHGGRIWIEGNAEGGSDFIFTLPRTP